MNCIKWKTWREYGEVFEDCMSGLRQGCCCPSQCPARERVTDWRIEDANGTPLKDTLGKPLCFNTERQANTVAKLIVNPAKNWLHAVPYIAGTNHKWE